MGYFKEELEPTILSTVGNFLGGLGDGVTDMVTGIYDMTRHPIRTAQGLGQIVIHPIKTVTAVGQAVGTSFVDNVIHGDANSRARFLGRTVFEVGSIVVPAKVASVGKIEKMVQAKKVQMALKGVDLVKSVSKTNAFVKVMNIIEKADIINKLNKLKFADDIIRGIKNVPANVRTTIDDILEKVNRIPETIGNIEVPVIRRMPELAGFGNFGFYTENIKLSEIYDDISKMTGGAGKNNVDEILELGSDHLTKEQRKYYEQLIEEAEITGDIKAAEGARYKRNCQSRKNRGKEELPYDKWKEKHDRMRKNSKRGYKEEPKAREALESHIGRKLENNNEGTVRMHTSEGKTTRPDSIGLNSDGKIDLVHDHKHFTGEGDQVIYDTKQLRAERKMIETKEGKHIVTVSSDNPNFDDMPIRPRPSRKLVEYSEIYYTNPGSGKITHKWDVKADCWVKL